MNRRVLACCGGLTLVATLLVGLGSQASARPLDLRTAADGVQQVTLGGSGQLLPLVVDRMAPGMTVTARYEVHRGSQLSGGTFASEITHVQDLENGCMHSEAADGDGTCGKAVGQGELSSQLMVEQRWSAPSPDCTQPAGPVDGLTMADVEDLPVTAADSSGDTACLTLVVDLPMQADNLVQSDSSRFALRIGLVDATHAGDLANNGTFGGGHVSGFSVDRLPATGVDVRTWLLVTAAALLAGAALMLAGRVPTGAGRSPRSATKAGRPQ